MELATDSLSGELRAKVPSEVKPNTRAGISVLPLSLGVDYTSKSIFLEIYIVPHPG
jgi:hypothetical protein